MTQAAVALAVGVIGVEPIAELAQPGCARRASWPAPDRSGL